MCSRKTMPATPAAKLKRKMIEAEGCYDDSIDEWDTEEPTTVEEPVKMSVLVNGPVHSTHHPENGSIDDLLQEYVDD